MSKKHGFFLKQCKVCDKDVAWSVKKCPHCGVKNPTVTLKHQLITWAVLLLVIGFWLSPDNKEKSNPAIEVAKNEEQAAIGQEEVSAPLITTEIEQPLNVEQLRSDYALYQEKKNAAAELWNTVEHYLTAYEDNPSISLSEELTRYMKLAEQAAQGALFQEPPTGNKASTAAFKEMNSGLSGMFSNTAKRIQYALEISLGSKDPTKSMERYTRAKEMYLYNVQEFDQGALILEQLFDTPETNSNRDSAVP